MIFDKIFINANSQVSLIMLVSEIFGLDLKKLFFGFKVNNNK